MLLYDCLSPTENIIDIVPAFGKTVSTVSIIAGCYNIMYIAYCHYPACYNHEPLYVNCKPSAGANLSPSSLQRSGEATLNTATHGKMLIIIIIYFVKQQQLLTII